MTDLEFIKKIEVLKEIKPRKDWVILTKKEIFKEELPNNGKRISVVDVLSRFLFPNYKTVLASFIFIGLFFCSAYVLSKDALPGDLLYSIKRIAEKGHSLLASENEKPQVQLELTNKRLEELTKVAESNQIQKLSPAINEFKASASVAAKNLSEPKKLTKKIVQETKKIEENKAKVESLGVIIGENEELDNALSQLVDREIKVLEKATLTEEQTKILDEAKIYYKEGNFSVALEKILLASNQ